MSRPRSLSLEAFERRVKKDIMRARVVLGASRHEVRASLNRMEREVNTILRSGLRKMK